MMLKKTLILIFVLCTFQVFAQKNFEGKITYSLYAIDDPAQKRKMVIYLKADKIFAEGISNNSYATNSLYDFTLARRYDFIEDSVVTYSILQRNIFPYINIEADTVNAFITIAKYKCKKKTSSIYPPMNTSFTSVENWFTDQLFFKVSDSANFTTPPLFFFNENSISLRTKIILNRQMMPEHNEIIIEAIEVSEENIEDSRFKIPDYKRVLTVEAYSKEVLEKFKAVNSELNNKQ